MKKYITITILMLATMCLAYKGETHNLISQLSILNSSNFNYSLHKIKLRRGDVLIDTIQDVISQGAVQEDGWETTAGMPIDTHWEATEDIFRTINHFFDPYYDQGLNDGCLAYPFVPEKRAVDWALTGFPDQENIYDLNHSLQYYFQALREQSIPERRERFRQFFLSIGHFMHMNQDMAVPAHVRNDNHAISNNGELTLGDRYESYAYGVNTVDSPGYSVMFDDLVNFWSTEDDRGLADYTNANFVSQDTNLDHHLHACRDPLYYDQPEVDGFYDELEYLGTNTYMVRYYRNYVWDHYNQNVMLNPYMSTSSFWNFYIGEDETVRVFSMNNKNYEAYTDLLLPRAVAYSAGLLDYIFEPSIYVTARYGGAETGWSLKVWNSSNMDFGEGYFYAYWFNYNDGTHYPYLETRWIDLASHPVQFEYGDSKYIESLDSHEWLDIHKVSMDISNHTYPQIQLLVFFHGVINGEPNRTAATVVDLDVSFPEVTWDRMVASDYYIDEGMEPIFRDTIRQEGNNSWYLEGSRAFAYRYGGHYRLEGHLNMADKDSLETIMIHPGTDTSNVRMFVNGQCVGQVWRRYDYPDMIPDTIVITFDFYDDGKIVNLPEAICNYLGVGMYKGPNPDWWIKVFTKHFSISTKLPFVDFRQSWGIRTNSHIIRDQDDYETPYSSHEFGTWIRSLNVRGVGLASFWNMDTTPSYGCMNLASDGEASITLDTRHDYTPQEDAFDQARSLLFSAHQSHVDRFNEYSEQYEDMDQYGQFIIEYTDHDRALAWELGYPLSDYSFPLVSE